MKYEKPEMVVLRLDFNNIVTTSGTGDEFDLTVPEVWD